MALENQILLLLYNIHPAFTEPSRNGLPLFTPLLPLTLGYFNKIKEAKWNYGESPIYIRKIIFLFKPPLDIRFCAKMLFAGVDGALNFFVMEFHFVHSTTACTYSRTPDCNGICAERQAAEAVFS